MTDSKFNNINQPINHVEPEILEETKKVLISFGDKYITSENILKRPNIIADLDNYNGDLMQVLLSNKVIHDSYTQILTVNDKSIEIFEINKFIEMFTYKEYWEDSYTKFSNKIGLTSSGKFIDESTDVVLDFPFKDTILKAGMTKEDDSDADEPFLHETIAKTEIDQLLSPKIFVNSTKYDSENIEGKPVDSFDIENDSLIINGNNLIALYSLRERYAGKVKLIYIDPPYNTGNDSFNYNDRFNHSAWLTFMKNRLEVARELLSDEGIITIQTDYHENAYLKVLLDQIFGIDNFVSDIAVKMSPASGPKMAHVEHNIPKLKDDILVYKKKELTVVEQPMSKKEKWDTEYSKILMNLNENDVKDLKLAMDQKNIDHAKAIIMKAKISTISLEFPDKKDDEKWLKDNAWRILADKPNKGLSNKLARDNYSPISSNNLDIVETSSGNLSFIRTDNDFTEVRRLEFSFAIDNLSQNMADFWSDISTTGGAGMQGGVNFTNAKKPEKLLRRIIGMFSNKNDLVLDFFMGSATTQSVAMKMNRRFIGIEQMDYIKDVSAKRLIKVIQGEQGGISKDVNWQGGGSFIYTELMQKNINYIQEIQQTKKESELNNIFNKMVEQSADFDFRVDLSKYLKDVKDSDLSFEEKKKQLISIIDKNQLYYPYSQIDDQDIKNSINDNDIKFNKSFYESEDE